MKKTSILLIALALVMLFASSAFAAQAVFTVGSHAYATPTTVATVTYGVYDFTNGTFDKNVNNRVYGETKFYADGVTKYPYEIYLPSEKNPAQYRIHTNYSKSTDACASCHATHTAVGPSLLQWYSVYDTCIACHDGTVTTTYNVVEGRIADNPNNPTYGGMFGIGNELSLSNHNVTGAVTIASAPGGSVTEVAANRGFNSFNMWSTTFGCESCHTPHGQGGNARILSPDPNGYASKTNQQTDLQYNTVSGAIYDLSVDKNVYIPLISGYPYKPTYIDESGQEIELTQNFIIHNNGKDTVTNGAYTYITAKTSHNRSEIKSIKGVVGIQVRMDIDNYLQIDETVKHVAGINAFCGACHVDYNTEPYVTAPTGNGISVIMGAYEKRPGYEALTGTYSSAHRHAVGLKWNYAGAADDKYIGWDNEPMLTVGTSDEGREATNGGSYISCLTCHFAHGTSEGFWLKWVQKYPSVTDDWNTTTLHEISGSSALKRLPNMATCEACHQKGADAAGYNYNTDQDGFTNATTGLSNEGIFTPAGAGVTNAQCQNATCHQHQNVFATYGQTEKGKAGKECTTCHGPAGNHMLQPSAKNILNPRNLSATEQSNKCISGGCHAGGSGLQVDAQFNASVHKLSGVISCNTCHDSHKLNTDNKPLKGEYNALCASCHSTTFSSVNGAVYHATNR